MRNIVGQEISTIGHTIKPNFITHIQVNILGWSFWVPKVTKYYSFDIEDYNFRSQETLLVDAHKLAIFPQIKPYKPTKIKVSKRKKKHAK